MSSISVVIPTYNRGHIVFETIEQLLNQSKSPEEIIIVDQTHYQEQDPAARALKDLDGAGRIRWCRLTTPSIPKAMNRGLLLAKSEYVLFLDDDSSVAQDLVARYYELISEASQPGIVGQVLQPGEVTEKLPGDYRSGNGLSRDLHFQFNYDTSTQIADCIACNFLVNRKLAIECGGFDEQFEKVAYRFETEFARRLIRTTGRLLLFAPSAKVNHLKTPTGGTRAKVANFLTSAEPVHSQGDYYFALRESHGWERWSYMAKRLFGCWWAKFYIFRPWWIPVRFVGELRGVLHAFKKKSQGPRYINAQPDER